MESAYPGRAIGLADGLECPAVSELLPDAGPGAGGAVPGQARPLRVPRPCPRHCVTGSRVASLWRLGKRNRLRVQVAASDYSKSALVWARHQDAAAVPLAARGEYSVAHPQQLEGLMCAPIHVQQFRPGWATEQPPSLPPRPSCPSVFWSPTLITVLVPITLERPRAQEEPEQSQGASVRR